MLWTSQKPRITSLHHWQSQQPPQLLASTLSPLVTPTVDSPVSSTAAKPHLKAFVVIPNRTQLKILIITA